MIRPSCLVRSSSQEVRQSAPRCSSTLHLGVSRSNPCGVHHHAEVLSDALTKNGCSSALAWVTQTDSNIAASVRAAWQVLVRARSAASGSSIIWHYSAHAYGHRGISLFGVLAGLLARRRGARVIVVLHEIVLPWGGSWRALLTAASHRLALPWVLIGADAWVVTTSDREEALRPAAWLLRRPLRLIPVFANVVPAESALVERDGGSGGGVGILGWAAGEDSAKLVLQGIHDADARVPILLLGAPGIGTRPARAWQDAAEVVGAGEQVTFSGVIPSSDLSEAIARCAVVVLAYSDGPSSRRGTLAAALAHGKAVAALDGPNTWDVLRQVGAVKLAVAAPKAVADAVRGLLSDVSERRCLEDRAALFYRTHLSIRSAVERYEGLLEQLDRAGAP